MDTLMIEWVNELMNGWIIIGLINIGWMGEWMDRWMNEWVDE